MIGFESPSSPQNQTLNALLLGFGKVVRAIFTGERQAPAFSDETLSAHCYRASKAGNRVALFFLPIIDFLFRWQTRNHCYGAYMKEMQRRNLPPEYR